MAVPFGFSVGDFIAAINLVGTIMTALRETNGSRAKYRGLIAELDSLETVLLKVKLLDHADIQRPGDAIALEQAASRCVESIDDFWDKIRKYHPYLQESRSGARVKETWMKVKWALCKKADIDEFRVRLRAHTDIIGMLLSIIHLNTTSAQGRTRTEQHHALARCVRESHARSMNGLSLILRRSSRMVQQAKQMLTMTTKIMQTTYQIFQIVVNIQDLLTRIAPQVEFEQPVYFVDVLNRRAAFQLSFVCSREAFFYCLKEMLKSVDQAAQKSVDKAIRKIDRREFIIEDTATGREIDLTQDWHQCFRPGQRIGMSMLIWSGRVAVGSHCCVCGISYLETTKTDLTCPSCGETIHGKSKDPRDEPEELQCFLRAVLENRNTYLPPLIERPLRRQFHLKGGPSIRSMSSRIMTDGEMKFADTLACVASFAEAANIISNGISMKLSKMLSIPRKRLKADKPLYAYGVDSLVAVELRRWITKEMDATTTVIDILGHSTLEELARNTAKKSSFVPVEVKEQEKAREGQKAAD